MLRRVREGREIEGGKRRDIRKARRMQEKRKMERGKRGDTKKSRRMKGKNGLLNKVE